MALKRHHLSEWIRAIAEARPLSGGLWTRRDMEFALDELDRMSATVSEWLDVGLLNGIECIGLEPELDRARLRVRNRLVGTVQLLQDRDALAKMSDEEREAKRFPKRGQRRKSSRQPSEESEAPGVPFVPPAGLVYVGNGAWRRVARDETD